MMVQSAIYPAFQPTRKIIQSGAWHNHNTLGFNYNSTSGWFQEENAYPGTSCLPVWKYWRPEAKNAVSKYVDYMDLFDNDESDTAEFPLGVITD